MHVVAEGPYAQVLEEQPRQILVLIHAERKPQRGLGHAAFGQQGVQCHQQVQVEFLEAHGTGRIEG